MHNTKAIIWIKICLLVAAIILAGVVFFIPASPQTNDPTTVIIIDMHTWMLTQDIIAENWALITRLDAAKQIITQLVQTHPERSFWLVTYGDEINYLIPPTLDTWNLLQYANGLLVLQSWNVEALKRWSVSEWSTWLSEALKWKQLVIIGDIDLPSSLRTHAINLLLWTQIHSLNNRDVTTKNLNLSTFPPLVLHQGGSNLSTFQATWLIVLLCLISVLAL